MDRCTFLLAWGVVLGGWGTRWEVVLVAVGCRLVLLCEELKDRVAVLHLPVSNRPMPSVQAES